jgi:hypothetical protein
MEKGKSGKPGLDDFERTHLERLRLAAQIILDAAGTGDLVCDGLEVELGVFKDRVEFALLLPEYSPGALPWRGIADGIRDDISREDQ